METPGMPETSRPAAHDDESGDQSTGEESPQQQRARRLAALSALAAAPRTSAASSGESGQPMPGSVLAVRRPRWRRARVGLAVVVLLGVAATAVWKLHPLTTPTSAVSRPSVPVQMLPNAD